MFSAAGRQPDTPPGPGHRRGLVDGLARLPRRPAVDRLPGRRDLAAVGALTLLILGAASCSRSRAAQRRRRSPAADRTSAAARPSAVAGAMTFAAVLSDLDGVLVDSAAATSRARGRRGARAAASTAPPIQAANHGRPARDIVAEHVAARAGRRRGGVPARRRGRPTPPASSPSRRRRRARAAGRRDRDVVHAAARARRLAAAGLASPTCSSRRPGRARQARARSLPAGRRAARRRPGGLPRARGRAERASRPAAPPGMTVWAVARRTRPGSSATRTGSRPACRRCSRDLGARAARAGSRP